MQVLPGGDRFKEDKPAICSASLGSAGPIERDRRIDFCSWQYRQHNWERSIGHLSLSGARCFHCISNVDQFMAREQLADRKRGAQTR